MKIGKWHIKDSKIVLAAAFTTVFVAGVIVGRNSHATIKQYRNQVDVLNHDITLLEEHLVECWNDLPLGCIREGSIDN